LIGPECWRLCETNHNPELHPSYPPAYLDNRVISVTWADGPDIVEFARPITPGEATTIMYVDVNGQTKTFGPFVSLPGDVSGDLVTNAADVLSLIDTLNAMPCSLYTCPVPWAEFSYDIDRNGDAEALDILELIDLLNGAGAYKVWNSVSIPADGLQCTIP